MMLFLNIFLSSSTGAEVSWAFVDNHHEYLLKLFGRSRFQELLIFLCKYLKRLSQYRSLKLIYSKFEFVPGDELKNILKNRVVAKRDIEQEVQTMEATVMNKGL